jgi:hypothetical protein
MELATGMGLPPLVGNEERLSFILKKSQVSCWGIFNETDKEGWSALDAASKWRRDNLGDLVRHS